MIWWKSLTTNMTMRRSSKKSKHPESKGPLMFLFKARKTKVYRFYREYLACWGWGVMCKYDSVWAKNSSHARTFPQSHEYIKGDYEGVWKVKREHLHMTDDQLSELYGLRHQE